MNTIEVVYANDEKYIGLKNFCNSIKGNNQSSFNSYFIDSEKNILNIEDKLLFAIDSIKDFNINDIVHNYHCPYRYTTVLEYILRTENSSIINIIFNKYLNEIKEDICINENHSYKLLTILYANLEHDNCITDTLTILIFKFENLEFLNVIDKFERKLLILRYLDNQKDNFNCRENFYVLIKSKYKEVLQEQELYIFKIFEKYVNSTQQLVNNLISDSKYEPTNRMVEFHRFLKSLQ